MVIFSKCDKKKLFLVEAERKDIVYNLRMLVGVNQYILTNPLPSFIYFIYIYIHIHIYIYIHICLYVSMFSFVI